MEIIYLNISDVPEFINGNNFKDVENYNIYLNNKNIFNNFNNDLLYLSKLWEL